DRGAGIDVHRVAEFVWLRRGGGFDAGAEMARVVAARTAAADGPEQVAQGAIAEEIERLVGDLEFHRAAVFAVSASAAATMFALVFKVRRLGDEPLVHHLLHDLLNELLQLVAGAL